MTRRNYAKILKLKLFICHPYLPFTILPSVIRRGFLLIHIVFMQRR